jgi:hypothetical protein
MKFKGKTVIVDYTSSCDTVKLTLEDLEQADEGLISNTKNGKIEISRYKPSLEEIRLGINKNYIVSMSDKPIDNRTDCDVKVDRISIEKGLGLVTYYMSSDGEQSVTTEMKLTLPVDFDIDIKLRDTYYIYWEKTN